MAEELIGKVAFCLRPCSRKRPLQQVGATAPLIGYVFRDEHSRSYLLSAPQALMRRICVAIQLEATIRITNYTRIPLLGREDLVAHLEVHKDGLSGRDVKAAGINTNISDKSMEKEAWTLSQIRRREAVDKITQFTVKNTLYTFQARVHAVSPILTFDASDPCCLVELYEPETSCSCVLVLRLASLALHAAILPDQDLMLRNVKRSFWSTPMVLEEKEYRRLATRIPSYVFVVENLMQVELQACDDEEVDETQTTKIVETLSGTVVSVHMTESETGIVSVRYIELVKDDGSQCNLFLTHFPLDSGMHMSLQRNAKVKVYNVHKLGQSQYGVCLRSTVALMETASESSNDLYHRSQRKFHQMEPCAFHRIQRTTPEWVCRHLVDVFLNRIQKTFEHTNISKERLVKALLDPELFQCSSRIAYAEFFDHCLDEWDGCLDPCQDINNADNEGCHLSRSERLGLALPCILDLDTLRSKVSSRVLFSVDSFIDSNRNPVGWTGSCILSGWELAHAVGVNSFASIYTGGMVELSVVDDVAPAMCVVWDDQVVLPFSFHHSNGCVTFCNKSFALVRVTSVVLSFVCLGHANLDSGTSMKIDSNEDNTQTSSLPPQRRKNLVSGACSIVRRKGYLFAVSIRLESDNLLSGSGDQPTEEKQAVVANKAVVLSIRECLDPPASRCNESTIVEGRLVRKFFKLQKSTNKVYKGFMCVLSHIQHHSSSKALMDTSSIQSIEIKPTIRFADELTRQLLHDTVAKSFGLSLPDDQLAVAFAWWTISDNERTCALLGGGWEELCGDGPVIAKQAATIVRIPRSKVVVDENRGYVRVRCSMDDVFAAPTCHEPSDILVTHEAQSFLHFVGGERFFPGMLDRRPLRKAPVTACSANFSLSIGERYDQPSEDEVATLTLGQLHSNICFDLRSQSRINLAPSLVRRIRNASTLGVLYCQVTAECTKCFSSLKMRAGKDSKRKGHSTTATMGTGTAQSSFWDVPLPISSGNNAQQPIELTKQRQSTPQPPTNLSCSNNCDATFAGIKWECSCVLDDGTGQAKLFAERDVTLVLLGMPPETKQLIEKGAWLQENGIVFSKGMPPKSYLRGAIQDARYLANEHLMNQRRTGGGGGGGGGRQLQETDVIRFLSPIAAAEYLLQRHCRESKEPLRELDFFVRCKPMSDEAHLNQTSIEVAAPGIVAGECTRRDLATYALPPLKLNLVDCGVKSVT